MDIGNLDGGKQWETSGTMNLKLRWKAITKRNKSERLTESQPMVLLSRPHCRDEFCTPLAHIFFSDMVSRPN